ncbi:hypothetical protein NDU88_001056 [Pleurodeles waltl]|uniref:Uncharacterized protein n=1 Tax=Pleurodeles waltl TaxID=8319 RepID=A0AAV7MIN6_PLEWA|nr:hypothetical protein NDU88_001056 [Pleurodeles waltl]
MYRGHREQDAVSKRGGAESRCVAATFDLSRAAAGRSEQATGFEFGPPAPVHRPRPLQALDCSPLIFLAPGSLW